MSQAEDTEPTMAPITEPVTWRTPGRKLTKEDLSVTSALILGCTCQPCCDPKGTGPETGLTDFW
jgi:hypothetical protein